MLALLKIRYMIFNKTKQNKTSPILSFICFFEFNVLLLFVY